MNVSLTTLDSAIKDLETHSVYGLDTETTGLLWSDRLFNLIIATKDTEYVFTFEQNGTVPEEFLLDKKTTLTKLMHIFSDASKKWRISNAKFDLRMLHHDGVHLAGIVVCLHAMGRIYKNNRLGYRPYSLESQAHDYIKASKDDAVLKYIKKHKLTSHLKIPGKGKIYERLHFDRVPYDVMSVYSATDGRLHYDLGEFFQCNLSPDLLDVANIECAVTKAASAMEIKGIKINRVYTQSAFAYEEGLIRESMESFRATTGLVYDNKKATLIKVFESEGATIPLTDKGNPSMTDEVLEEIDSPAAQVVRRIRGHEKRLSTYYSSFLFFADQEDVIHADFVQSGTETGRFSCRDPNLQNLPKEDEEEDGTKPFWVRGCFQPRPGFMFSSIDYKQQEFRMLADYAGEIALIKRILGGEDVHTVTAEMAGITRSQAKTLNFGLIYGMGTAKLARSLGISLNEARDLKLRYFARFPRIEMLLKEVAKRGTTRGFIRTWTGRRQHLSSPDYAYILPNHLIQGGCGDVIKIAINKHFAMPEYGLMPIVSTIHDELVFEHRPEHIDLLTPVRTMMESIYRPQNGMILQTDHSISYNTLAKLEMEKYGV